MTLNAVLAELYSDESSIKRLASQAGVDVARVKFTGTAANTWSALMAEAQHQGKTSELVAAALAEYPTYPPLIDALLPASHSTPKDGFMSFTSLPTSHESDSASVARLATQLEFLTAEVRRVSDGLNGIKGLNVERIDRGLDDIAWMRGRVVTLTWAVAVVTGMTMLLGVAFLAHI